MSLSEAKQAMKSFIVMHIKDFESCADFCIFFEG